MSIVPLNTQPTNIHSRWDNQQETKALIEKLGGLVTQLGAQVTSLKSENILLVEQTKIQDKRIQDLNERVEKAVKENGELLKQKHVAEDKLIECEKKYAEIKLEKERVTNLVKKELENELREKEANQFKREHLANAGAAVGLLGGLGLLLNAPIVVLGPIVSPIVGLSYFFGHALVDKETHPMTLIFNQAQKIIDRDKAEIENLRKRIQELS